MIEVCLSVIKNEFIIRRHSLLYFTGKVAFKLYMVRMHWTLTHSDSHAHVISTNTDEIIQVSGTVIIHLKKIMLSKYLYEVFWFGGISRNWLRFRRHVSVVQTPGNVGDIKEGDYAWLKVLPFFYYLICCALMNKNNKTEKNKWGPNQLFELKGL